MQTRTRVVGWGMALALAAVPLAATPGTAAPASADEVSGSAPTGVTHAQNPSVPAGASWTEEYFPSSAPSSNGDPVQLHADVLRPEGLAPGEKTPVIMSIGPYFSHSGSNVDTHPAHTGPSSRFTDLIDGAGLMARGYTFVYVDLRGFGASTGCIDWLGPGEQADVVSAVEWAAAQSWSTGAVGLYGKSYDGSTGLAGVDLQPEGLKAVVAQEPSWSGYDYLITNGVSRPQQIESPLSYLGIADLPGVDHAYHQDGYDIAPDTAQYLSNAAYEKTHPECAQTVTSQTREMDRQSEFWRSRDLPANVGGSTVPLMFTQGLTEQNTKPESMQQFLSNHAGEERAWLGPWDHVRGNETDAQGRLQMGRSTWFEEVMAFYDAHLKEETDEVTSSFFIQDNFGAWRAQDTWGTTAKTVSVALRPGSYLDTGTGTKTDDDPGSPNPNPLLMLDEGDGTGGDTGGDGQTDSAPESHDPVLGTLTLSHPLRSAVRLTGTPTVELHTQGAGNVAVQLWDVAPDRTGVMINNSVSTLSADGVTRFGLLGMDWTLAAGHSFGVTYDTIDWGFWVPRPSGTEVTVTGATVDVAVESTSADVPTAGAPAPFFETYLKYYTREEPIPAGPETFTLSASVGRIGTDAATVVAGASVVVTGEGYDPGAPVALSWLDAAVATPAPVATTDASGAFRAVLPVPVSTPAGPVTLMATAEDGGRSSLGLEVVAAVVPAPGPTPVAVAGDTAPAALARTGLATDGLAGAAPVAAFAILLGASLALLRRRGAAQASRAARAARAAR